MLGRPLPLFDHVAYQLAHLVTQRLQHSGHRNVHIVLTQAHWQPLRSAPHEDTATASIARQSVLALMDARYGFSTRSDTTNPDALPAISATEQRIAASTEALVLQALNDLLPAPAEVLPGHIQYWQWHAQLEIDGRGAHPLSIALDAGRSQCLEQRIDTMRQAQQGHHPHHAPAATAPLQVNVVARVVEKTVTAADIYKLQPGSMLPIALGRATVLLNDSAMLTASVAEHKGKLHLTAFENLE